MFHRIYTLIIKELQTLLRDPEGRRFLILPVLMQLCLFPFVTMEVKHNTLGIMNQDDGPLSVELIQRFATAKAFENVVSIKSEAELKETVEMQKALLVLRFPSDFSRALESGKSPVLQVILDGRRSTTGQIAMGYVADILQAYSLERAEALVPGATGASPLRTSLVVRHWFNPNLDFTWYILPSLVAIITTIGALIVTSLSIAREREQGTFDQLLVSPLTPGMIMLGKAIPALIISMSQASIILLAAIFVYRVPFSGNLFLMYGSMFFYMVSLVGFGLFISSICSSQQQAFLGTFSFMMPAMLLSGYSAPIDNMPQWLQTITWFNPLRHFIVISKDVFLKNIDFFTVLEHVWPLWVIAAITLTGASIIFRFRLG
ncbi:MAG: ABC transporter permease [Candidatus Methylacidiphilales bacterium]|nr:ABC transporter permease [Candidatus Methylacidiphilales bacterium]